MAVALTRTRSDHLQLQRKFKEKDEQKNHHHENHRSHGGCSGEVDKKRTVVPVVYYLSRNGQLEHPHFIEVPLSSPQGLYLRDVINRLNLLRGKSMASHYSWSSKRSYKSGFVWHDLEENDFIQAVHGGEYVLKGSEIQETTSLLSPSASKSSETSSSSGGGKIDQLASSEFPAARIRRRNQSWGAIDLHEYKVYKSTESTHEFAAADASTQTDDKSRRRNAVLKEEPVIIEEEDEERREKGEEIAVVSPPPSDSSPETLETLMKADKRLIITNVAATSSSSQAVDQIDGGNDRTAEFCPSGRMKASSVLMSLISCGSVSFRDCGATAVKDHGLSLISQCKSKVPRGENRTEDHHRNGDVMMGLEKNVSSSFAKMALEDKEYFSGSLVETSKNKDRDDHQFSALKRSSSYNADRSSQLTLAEDEVEGVRVKCIPRKPKMQLSNKKPGSTETSAITVNNTQDGN